MKSTKIKLKLIKVLVTYIFLISALSLNAQFGTSGTAATQWNASWVKVPEAGDNTPGLYLFRKTLALTSVPDSFIVYVSGDNRYKLYVNEILVSLGPTANDIANWNYEIVDLAPYLKAGQNIVSALVWNEGTLKPVMQFSLRTGFILQGAYEETHVINTNDSWKCIQDNSYTPISVSVRGYYAAGAGEQIDMQHQIKGWKQLSFDDSKWLNAQPIFATGGGQGGARVPRWTLVPSILPQMEHTPQRLLQLRRTEGVKVNSSFPAQKTSVSIPANTTATLLLDQTFLTNAYPTLIFSGGINSNITVTYAEALYDENNVKGNRNEIEGKNILGRRDIIISDGSANQDFTTLSYRTYRYVELKVETKDSPLVIEDFYGTFTGYPFSYNAKLVSNNAELDKILEIGWRTARLCAVDTYMDCPYYERLQYIGDARIQLIISYYNSGDDRLAKHALNLWDQSRQVDGFTFSRYPDALGQIIATYSLVHVNALYDYMMYGSDPDFVYDKMLGARHIMNYFISHQDQDGSVKNVPGWNFTDWATGWQRGTGPIGADGSSAVYDLQMLLALQSAIKLEEVYGKAEFAAFYSQLADNLAKTINRKYWDNTRRIFADTPEKSAYSQHTNTMAILAGIVDGQVAKDIANTMLTDTSLTETTIYFKYYLHLALAKAGLGDDYLDWLDIWRKYIDFGLTTWGETSAVESTRSDCHAWGSSPNIEVYRIILGIESNAPNFKAVKIQPNLGSINKISGEIPHPSGKIAVNYEVINGVLNAEINLPKDITGVFIWENKSIDLKGGTNNLKL